MHSRYLCQNLSASASVSLSICLRNLDCSWACGRNKERNRSGGGEMNCTRTESAHICIHIYIPMHILAYACICKGACACVA